MKKEDLKGTLLSNSITKTIVQPNIEDNDGEFLPYLVMGELCRLYIQFVVDEKSDHIMNINDLLIYMYEMDAELVSVGFLENLHQAEDNYKAVITALPNALQDEVKQLDVNHI